MKYLFPLLLLLSSCSSVSKSRLYGGIIGGVIGSLSGSVIGRSASPNKASRNANTIMGGSIGTALGATSGVLLGTYFYSDDPENKDLPPMILERDTSNISVPISESIKLSLSTLKPKRFASPTPLPEKLKEFLKKQYLIEHTIPEQIIATPNGKTFILKETSLIEHSYE